MTDPKQIAREIVNQHMDDLNMVRLHRVIAEAMERVRNEALEEAAKAAWSAVRNAAEKMDDPNACALMADIAESAVEHLALKKGKP